MMLRMVSPFLFTSAVASALYGHEDNGQKAREIIAAAIAAKGGKDRLLQWSAWHIKYRETFLADGKKRVEEGNAYEHLALGQARYETSPDDVVVVNNQEGWHKKGAKVTALSAGQLADFQEYFKGKESLLTLLPLLTDEWHISFVGEKNLGGAAASVVRIAHKNWLATTYWDRNTHLLIRAEYPHKKLLEPDDSKRTATTRESRFSAYKSFDGILFHTKLLGFSHGKQSGEVEFVAIELMKRLPDGIIEAPK